MVQKCACASAKDENEMKWLFIFVLLQMFWSLQWNEGERSNKKCWKYVWKSPKRHPWSECAIHSIQNSARTVQFNNYFYVNLACLFEFTWNLQQTNQRNLHIIFRFRCRKNAPAWGIRLVHIYYILCRCNRRKIHSHCVCFKLKQKCKQVSINMSDFKRTMSTKLRFLCSVFLFLGKWTEHKKAIRVIMWLTNR